MIRFNFFSKLIPICYIFFYLISSKLAICENINKRKVINFGNELNQRDFAALEKYFYGDEKISFKNKFRRFIEEFPNAKWEIMAAKSINANQENLTIKVYGSKILNGKKLQLESNFNFLFSFENGIIKNSNIKNTLTTIRNDNNQIDIDISIPNKVLTGTNYELDIVINEPLEEIIIAGGIKNHQENQLLNESILLEPLATGGIFKVTRAPVKPGIQIWSGLIAHPEGIISFTKSVEIVEKL